MNTDIASKRILMCDEVLYGKPVRSKFGPVYDNAPYGINSTTSGIDSPLHFVPANYLNASNLASNMIDPEYMRRGALIVKAVEEGVSFMRIRYRAEAGEGESGRQFLLARTLLLPGIKYWHEMPEGIFSWCEKMFHANPFVFDQPTVPTDQKVELPEFEPRGVDWYDGLSRHRQIQLGSTFQAITRRVGWAVSEVVAAGEKQRPAALIASDLDVIASFPRKFPLRVNNKDTFILNLGLEPSLTPNAVCYFPAQRGSAIEAPDLEALRVEILNSKNEDSVGSEDKTKINNFDSLDRRIGMDPIPLKVSPRKIPY